MLIEFKVGNFLSFRDVQTLRMAQVLDDGCNGTSFSDASDKMFIYGANGSGKSNLIRAMSFARDIVLYGRSDISVATFQKKPGFSYFEYVVNIDGDTYSYGFELNPVTLEPKSEWLYILREDGDECLFEDELGDDSPLHTVVIRGELTLDPPRFWESRVVFVPHLRQVDVDDPVFSHAQKLIDWFSESLFIENSRMRDEIVPVSEGFMEKLGNDLLRFDTGITRIAEEPFINTDIARNLSKRIPGNRAMERDGDYVTTIVGGNLKRSWLIHTRIWNGSRTDSEIRFVHENGHISGIQDESLGTLRIIQILTLYSAMERLGPGCVVVADELECSVHSLIMRRFVDSFDAIAGKGQLIATTHRVDILGHPSVGNREVSFMDNDRSEEGGSRLYTLSSFDREFGPEERHRAYIDGRMAGVPVLREIWE